MSCHSRRMKANQSTISRSQVPEQQVLAFQDGSDVKRVVVAVSLANLCFVTAWHRRIYGIQFFLPLWSWRDLLALILNVTTLAAFLYILLRLAAKAKERGHSWAGLVYLMPLPAIMDLIRHFFHGRVLSLTRYGGIVVLIMAAVPALFGVALLCWQRKLLPVVEFVVLGLAILFPLNILKTALTIERYEPVPSLASKVPVPIRPNLRVIWLVFDEMDFGLSFPRRPAHLRVPEFDRLRSESLFATAADRPAADTEVAMPALITGRTVYHVEPQGTRRFLVSFSMQTPPRDLGAVPNVFSDARAAHLNVGIVGWFFPYCRIFASDVSECHWESMYSGVTDNPTLWTAIRSQLESLTLLESRMWQIERLHTIVAAAKSMADDPQLGLVLIHLPVPHGPQIFNRDSGQITPFAIHTDWFFDNLLLADRVLGEIRSAMERSGQWNSSMVIVTSDHSLRPQMMPHTNPTPLVPYMVKMPGQTTGTTFDQPFNALITRDLIGAAIHGEVISGSLPEWLRQHAR